MVRIDLHTHSEASYDGGISEQSFRQVLSDKLDVIAITDHNRIDFAQKLNSSLGDSIIVGEEISTDAGDIIGLYLTRAVKPYQTLEKAIQDIKQQDGIVYIPHPFETIRKGLSLERINQIIDAIDIIETQNGRAFLQNKHVQALNWARQHGIVGATSSDAHHEHGLGKSFSVIADRPTRKSLVRLLASCEHIYVRPSIRSLTAPKINRIKKTVRGKSNV